MRVQCSLQTHEEKQKTPARSHSQRHESSWYTLSAVADAERKFVCFFSRGLWWRQNAKLVKIYMLQIYFRGYVVCTYFSPLVLTFKRCVRPTDEICCSYKNRVFETPDARLDSRVPETCSRSLAPRVSDTSCLYQTKNQRCVSRTRYKRHDVVQHC